MLLDMGVENRRLYTADITRTLPVNGEFTPLQRKIYELVLRRPEGGHRRGPAGRRVPRLPRGRERGPRCTASTRGACSPVSAEEALELGVQAVPRYTLHGISHMLGLDVHDCAAARSEVYVKGELEPGMC